LYLVFFKNTLQNTKWRTGKYFFFQTPCPQTLSQVMFNKFKQECSDVKATASRKIRLTVHFDSRVTADEVLTH